MKPSIVPLTPITPWPETTRLFYLPNLDGERGNDTRFEMRELLRELLSAHGHASPEELLELERRPYHPELHINISHCKDAGLIGWALKPLKIGVDVEQVERIQTHLIRRVSLPGEISEAPRPELLWSAKEAAFKSRSDAVEVISSVEIFDWHALGDQTWSFKARVAQDKNTVLGAGEICLIQRHSTAFFLANH